MIASFGRIVNWIEDIVASAFLLTGLGLVFVSVICRYVLNDPIFWADEVAAYLIIWSAMLGFSIAFKENRHIRVVLFYNVMPYKVKRIFSTLVALCGLIFCILFTIAGIQLEEIYMMLGQESLNAQIPLWIPYIVVPISGVTFGLRFLFELLFIFKNGGKDWAEREERRKGELH
ncbi:TRAP transporter small permease [Selenomonadales bacterium OttesenSCG-928-I06]|nr:TRAP transporter small permease [Selenomonadales bacterium OttesenSCG-928-I06]